MLSLLALIATAFAADGYYDTASIAAASATFTNANTLQTTYADVSGRSAAIADALNDYQVSLDLLGGAAPVGDQEHLDGLKRQFSREQATLQGFVGDLIDEFDGTFVAAMERAIASNDGTAAECEARVAVGRQLPGMPSRTEVNPDCTGEDLNDSIAAAMDEDPALAPAVDALMAREWPRLNIPQAQRSATVGTVAVPVLPFAERVMTDTLRRIERADDDARLPVEAALEDGTDASETARLREQVVGIESQIAGLRNTSFLPVWEAATKRFNKGIRKGGPQVGWCANPSFFGGCTVPMLDDAGWRAVADHNKVRKAARS